jgi:hypothetical protein
MRIPEHKADMCRSDRIIWNVPERSRTFQNDGGALRTRGARSARARTACCFRQRAAALPPRSRARAPAPLRHSCRAAGDSQLLSLSGQRLSLSSQLLSLSSPPFPSPTSQGPRAQQWRATPRTAAARRVRAALPVRLGDRVLVAEDEVAVAAHAPKQLHVLELAALGAARVHAALEVQILRTKSTA